nr:hypothetical protein [Tanacetum cinerariifolium]
MLGVAFHARISRKSTGGCFRELRMLILQKSSRGAMVIPCWPDLDLLPSRVIYAPFRMLLSCKSVKEGHNFDVDKGVYRFGYRAVQFIQFS